MEASDEVCDEAEVVHSDRIVVLWAMQELVMLLLANTEQSKSPYSLGSFNVLKQRRCRGRRRHFGGI